MLLAVVSTVRGDVSWLRDDGNPLLAVVSALRDDPPVIEGPGGRPTTHCATPGTTGHFERASTHARANVDAMNVRGGPLVAVLIVATLAACANGSVAGSTPPDGALSPSSRDSGNPKTSGPDGGDHLDAASAMDTTGVGTRDATSADATGAGDTGGTQDVFVSTDTGASMDTGAPGMDSGGTDSGGSTTTCPNTALYIGEAAIAVMASSPPYCAASGQRCQAGDCAYTGGEPVVPCVCVAGP